MERSRRTARGFWMPDWLELVDEARFLAGRARRRLMRRPAHYAVAAAFAAIVLVVAVNAAFLQPGPHPSPLFSAARETVPEAGPAKPAPAEPAATAPAAPDGIASVLSGDPAEGAREEEGRESSGLVAELEAGLAALGLHAGPVDGRLDAATVQAIEAFQRSRGLAVTGEPTMDLLVALATGAPATRPEVEKVARVQAALNAGGFGPLDVDGIMGRMTGDAIRRFERANGLSETGEVSPRLERALGIEPGA